MNNNLLAFDFDGTLFYTDEANQRAYNDALSDFGYTMTKEYYIENCSGKSYKKFLPELIKKDDMDLITEIHERKKKYYKKYYSLIKINAKLFDMIKKLHSKCKTAIVTTASRTSVLDILSAFSVLNYFDFIIAKEDVLLSKPDPEGYIAAMRMADATPLTTTIFEDSAIGLRAARASGANVVAV